MSITEGTHITIIGLGLLGSSLARVLRWKLHDAVHITGCNHSAKTLDRALELQLVDSTTTDVAESVKNADMVVICTPMGTYEDTAKALAPALKQGAIVTDIGSVKQYAIDTIVPYLKDEHKKLFVPAHPIAGSEKSGIDAGFATIYQGKKVIITPTEQTDKNAIAQVRALWELADAVVQELAPEYHDMLYARVSHGVQLVISCYAASASGKELPQDEAWQCFMRLAGSSASMWRDIALTNNKPILQVLGLFKQAFASEIDMEGMKDKRLSLYDSDAVGEKVSSFAVPQKIAASLVAAAEEFADKELVGTGFRDATSPLLYVLSEDASRASDDNFIATLDEMESAIKQQDGDKIEAIIAKGKEVYSSCF